jgi:hypothetical protein
VSESEFLTHSLNTNSQTHLLTMLHVLTHSLTHVYIMNRFLFTPSPSFLIVNGGSLAERERRRTDSPVRE